MAWADALIPDDQLSAERWSAFSEVNGSTLYESREVYKGSLASTVQALYGKGLQEAFEAQAQALKIYVEGQN